MARVPRLSAPVPFVRRDTAANLNPQAWPWCYDAARWNYRLGTGRVWPDDLDLEPEPGPWMARCLGTRPLGEEQLVRRGTERFGAEGAASYGK